MSGLIEYATVAHELGDSGIVEGPHGTTQVKVAVGSPLRDVTAAFRLAGALSFCGAKPLALFPRGEPIVGQGCSCIRLIPFGVGNDWLHRQLW